MKVFYKHYIFCLYHLSWGGFYFSVFKENHALDYVFLVSTRNLINLFVLVQYLPSALTFLPHFLCYFVNTLMCLSSCPSSFPAFEMTDLFHLSRPSQHVYLFPVFPCTVCHFCLFMFCVSPCCRSVLLCFTGSFEFGFFCLHLPVRQSWSFCESEISSNAPAPPLLCDCIWVSESFNHNRNKDKYTRHIYTQMTY